MFLFLFKNHPPTYNINTVIFCTIYIFYDKESKMALAYSMKDLAQTLIKKIKPGTDMFNDATFEVFRIPNFPTELNLTLPDLILLS